MHGQEEGRYVFYIIQFGIFLFLFMDCFVLQISEKYLSFIIFLCNRKQIPNIPRSIILLLYDFESIFQFFNRRIFKFNFKIKTEKILTVIFIYVSIDFCQVTKF